MFGQATQEASTPVVIATAGTAAAANPTATVLPTTQAQIGDLGIGNDRDIEVRSVQNDRVVVGVPVTLSSSSSSSSTTSASSFLSLSISSESSLYLAVSTSALNNIASNISKSNASSMNDSDLVEEFVDITSDEDSKPIAVNTASSSITPLTKAANGATAEAKPTTAATTTTNLTTSSNSSSSSSSSSNNTGSSTPTSSAEQTKSQASSEKLFDYSH